MSKSSTANQPFPVTRWTLIAKAVGAGISETERREALEELCCLYWPPIYTFIRSKGATRVEAEDLTQGFFADFLARGDFQKPDPSRGKLRTFLLASVNHFMTNDWRARRRLKRGGGMVPLSLDGIPGADGETDVCLLEPADNVTPEVIFDRQWAMTLLEQVLRKLRKRYEEKGQGELFQRLKHLVSVGETGDSHAEIAADLRMTETAVKVAAHRLRKRYGALLREMVADTLLEDEEVEVEIGLLMASFG